MEGMERGRRGWGVIEGGAGSFRKVEGRGRGRMELQGRGGLSRRKRELVGGGGGGGGGAGGGRRRREKSEEGGGVEGVGERRRR